MVCFFAASVLRIVAHRAWRLRLALVAALQLTFAASAQELTLPITIRHHAGAVWPTGGRTGRLTRVDADNPTTRNPAINRSTTRVRFERLDAGLRATPTDSVRLPGWCTPMFTAVGAQHTLHRFRRQGSDSMISLAADTNGRIVAVKRQLHNREKSWEYLAIDHPLEGFLLANYGARHRQLWVRFLRPDLSEAWVWNLPATANQVRLDAYAADEQHLWLVVTDRADRRRRAATTAVCLDLRTGRPVQRLALDTPKTHRHVTACTLDSAHRLLVAGAAFDKRRPAHGAPGKLFTRHLSPDGTLSPELQVDLGGRRINRHVYWHHIEARPDGSVRLAGETYTATSKLAHHARVAPLWLIPVQIFSIFFHSNLLNYSTLRPRGMIVAELASNGTLESFRSLELPDGGKFKVHGFVPPRSLAVLAAQYGGLRWRGISPDSGSFLLRSPRRVVRVGLRDWSLTTIATAGRKNALDVWGYSGASAAPLVVETARRNRSVRFFYAAP